MILGIGIGLIIGFVSIVICILLIRVNDNQREPPWIKTQTNLLEKYWDRNNELRAEEVEYLKDISLSIRIISERSMTSL